MNAFDNINIDPSSWSYLDLVGMQRYGLPAKGTNTNDDAAAGQIGEYVESVVGATNFPATNVWGDLTSISLTAGDWDVTFVAIATLNASTMTTFASGISTVTGNDSTGLVPASNRINSLSPTATSDSSACISSFRMQPTATTTVYAKMLATYSAGGPPQIYGRLSARRVR